MMEILDAEGRVLYKSFIKFPFSKDYHDDPPEYVTKDRHNYKLVSYKPRHDIYILGLRIITSTYMRP